MAQVWKPGRGKLGVFKPLFGRWVHEGDSPMGRVRVERTFASVLGGAYVRMETAWRFGAGGAGAAYQETALFGVTAEGLEVWSFTSDGKHSRGVRVEAPDLHPQALAFESEMPAGRARQVYWPDPDAAGVRWVVESRTVKGWKRFTEHLYRPEPV